MKKMRLLLCLPMLGMMMGSVFAIPVRNNHPAGISCCEYDAVVEEVTAGDTVCVERYENELIELKSKFDSGDMDAGHKLMLYYGDNPDYSDTCSLIRQRLAELGDMEAQSDLLALALNDNDTAAVVAMASRLKDCGLPYTAAMMELYRDAFSYKDPVDSLRRCFQVNPDDAKAALGLAEYFYVNPYRTRDVDSALIYYEKAAEAGDTYAMAMCGSIYYNDYPERDPGFEVSKKWIEKSAGADDPFGAFCLAVLHDEGTVYPYDENEVNVLYEKAVVLGSPNALYNFGMGLVEGNHGHTDTVRGVELLEKAHHAGHYNAAMYLGGIYSMDRYVSPDLAKSREWLVESMKKLNHRAILYMAYTYMYGTDGNPHKAMEYIDEYCRFAGAEPADVNVYIHLLHRYMEEGERIERGASDGNEHDLYELALIRINNIGGFYKPDDVMPCLDALLEADPSYVDLYVDYLMRQPQMDMRRLEKLIRKYGLDDETSREYIRLKPFENKIETFKAKARRKDVQSMLNLAKCYEYGVGVRSNGRMAEKLYLSAAYLGSREAIGWLVTNIPDDANDCRRLQYWKEKAGK